MYYKCGFFVVLLVSMYSINAFINDLAVFEQDLQNLFQILQAPSKQYISWKLGSVLTGKTIGDVLSSGQRNNANVKAVQPIIIAQDAAKKVYQLYVLEQKFQTCTLHALRNFLYCMQALAMGSQEFPAWYATMLSQQSYELFQQQWCPLTQRKNIIPTLYYKILHDLKTSSEQRLLAMQLPAQTIQYLDKFLMLTFNIGITVYTKQLHSMSIVLNEVEAPMSQQHIERIFMLGSNSLDQCNKFLEFVHNYQNREAYTFGCELGVFTLMQHATTLVINKVNNQSEYIFMDSYFNNSFTNGSFAKNYQEAIFVVVDYVEQPQLLENDCLRYIFSTMLYTISNYERWAEKDISNLLKIPEQFEIAHNWLKKLKLLDTNFYVTKYKQAFLNKLELYKAKYPLQIELYNQVIDKFTL